MADEKENKEEKKREEVKLEKPKFPIPAEIVKAAVEDGKLVIEEGFRYTVASDGTLSRLPTYKNWNDEQKKLVKGYQSDLAAFKRAKKQKSLNYAAKRGAAAKEREMKGVLKEAKLEKRAATNAVKIEAQKTKLQERMAKDKARLEKLNK